ncbi:glyoxylate reductase hydroxypyruvate reductase isoform X2 [Micractinium conductrix]|uniref:Glyoxylate reductase hydroxypyruvate reductase isoform X2 n=1 Tax=Micractinium conductrix TaxID=554055 RepID=A0A2P6VIW6_9CHLO|nr:glyoxylate reductase hydroxypyruvate reductase isoform X2 [Micractinium conductrix]|eukprot:PSC74029.1 glyoxylate reductase hydroxypyruvate reductase isoform X2 [Micractinium conductrix]
MANSSDVPALAGAPLEVLFCGRDMHAGYAFTKQELEGETGVAVLQCDRDQLAAALATADVAVPLMCRLDAALLRAAPRLKLVIQYGVGVEGIDIPEATSSGVWVSNIPSARTGNAASCAEHAVYLLLACLRHHNAMADSIQQRRLGMPLGQTLLGKSVLVVGFGNIANELIVRLKPFGVHILVLRRKPWGHPQGGQAAGQQQQQQPLPQQHGQHAAERAQHDSQLEAAAEAALADRGVWGQDSARLAARADLIALTCHQDEHNRGMVDADFLAHCKPGVRIVNIARGGLLDYAAVREGLDSGRIAAMGLDVQEHEPVDPQHWLAQHPSVYLTPHVAGVTELSYRNMARVVADAVRRLQRRQPPERLLNAPPAPRGLAQ